MKSTILLLQIKSPKDESVTFSERKENLIDAMGSNIPGDGGFLYPSTQRHYRRLILILNTTCKDPLSVE
jgi:hypothetical protein